MTADTINGFILTAIGVLSLLLLAFILGTLIGIRDELQELQARWVLLMQEWTKRK
jgi:hypothetical protein